MKRNPVGRVIGIIVLGGFAGLFVANLFRPSSAPTTPRMAKSEKAAKAIAVQEQNEQDIQLIRQLVNEDLGNRKFAFATVMSAVSSKKVIALDADQETHQAFLTKLNTSLESITQQLSQEDSPVRAHRRINEVSRHFEDALTEAFNEDPDWSSGIPTNREGKAQRSGYPDIRIIHNPSDTVFYLDPKLVEQKSWKSSFRSFYFEPKAETLKINDDAVHLLVGIAHDGNNGAWTFPEWKVIDLSTRSLRLKPEFNASNADLYGE